MAILYSDSFSYSIATVAGRWTIVSYNGVYGSDITIQSTSGRFNGRWMQFTPNGSWSGAGNAYVYRVFSGTPDTLCNQFGFKTDATTRLNFFRVSESGTVQVYLSYLNGVMSVYNGSGTLIAEASSYIISTNVWHQIEFKVKINSTTGTVLLKVDGVTILNLSNVNTQNTGNAYANGFYFYCNYDSSGIMGISDVIIMDTTGTKCNNLLGSRMVEPKVGVRAGTYSQFDPSSSMNNYEAVNEIPPNDTDYNIGDVGDKDTFGFDAPSNPNATIDAVVCWMYAKTNDGGSAMMRGVAKSFSGDSDGDEGYGPEVAVPSSYDFLPSVIYVNPDSGESFIASEIGETEFGYERTS